MKTNLMQLLRLVLMVLAVAGVIYAIEFMERGIAVWFWVALLGIGFVGLLYTFRLTQRRVAREQRERQRLEKKRSRRSKRCPGTVSGAFLQAPGTEDWVPHRPVFLGRICFAGCGFLGAGCRFCARH